ncbi:hypothetical protein K435DRAFT_819891 [Dendrothele bispora CBS 962.96]|uniref:Alpha/beta-hydrolase n=1 Tax=Dendrothele bispora (strain CBS 962.96) TaxID=1314807 RepID=A0A4S8LYP2_DENBC|nr:hypothetical protein K435DRAFT_819891 [Dendrothele bispora CBS 962.96]
MDALVDNMNGGEPILGMSSRNRFGIPGHHPLYQPPLPTPPPGVVLGGGPKTQRRSKKNSKPPSLYSSDEDEEEYSISATPRRPTHRPPPRSVSSSTLNATGGSSAASLHSEPPTPSDEISIQFPTYDYSRTAPSTPSSKHKSLARPISDIIRLYAPDGQIRSRPVSRTPSCSHSSGHATVQEEPEPEPEPLTIKEEADLLSRSSIDSIAEEVQRTLRHQTSMQTSKQTHPPPLFSRRHSVLSDSASLLSPRSEGGTASIYSSSVTSSQPPLSPFDSTSFMASLTKSSSPSQAVAQYLRSARLTTLLKLTRSPHASFDNPLTVSLSDLGNPNGFPVVVFLGLGCVRHIMGLYDEMADLHGLRLITIDRWGLGRTEPRAKSAKGIIQWASVVEEVLDLMKIDQCSVMAHSAGAPYALSFANKLQDRIRGDICLLAPWVGGSENSSYKWLKYIPNGLLKTAQAAEWKLQTWMIGKPPTIAWEGIGHTAEAPRSTPERFTHGVYSFGYEGAPRPSVGSSNFSDYDDLRDFDGRFESRSTLGVSHHDGRSASDTKVPMARKPSKGILGRLKGNTPSSSHSQPQSPPADSPPPPVRKLKALRSMGSLKSKSSSTTKKSTQSSPRIPSPVNVDIGLGLEDSNWTQSYSPEQSTSHVDVTPDRNTPRSQGHRSISFTSSQVSALTLSPDAKSPEPPTRSPTISDNSYQIALGNALIAASHSESAKGTHNDLLQILNHDNHPWGFSYQTYPHSVRVWYGDKDEKIAEHAVRWMEKTMGEDQCSVKVVKGADHGLMYKGGVVTEVLECLQSFWQPPRP